MTEHQQLGDFSPVRLVIRHVGDQLYSACQHVLRIQCCKQSALTGGNTALYFLPEGSRLFRRQVCHKTDGSTMTDTVSQQVNQLGHIRLHICRRKFAQYKGENTGTIFTIHDGLNMLIHYDSPEKSASGSDRTTFLPALRICPNRV